MKQHSVSNLQNNGDIDKDKKIQGKKMDLNLIELILVTVIYFC